jgi:hypothetical protein
MNQKVMQRLIWKDARTIAPLGIATFAGILLCNALLYGFTAGTATPPGQHQLPLARMVWILLPNLLAFGAAAMLVGGEEESGSLAWLRTLPASWRGIALSKLSVALGSLMIAWTVGSVMYGLQWKLAPDALVTWAEHTDQAPDWSLPAVSAQLVFSIVLMLTSFIMAYWFRSPINALLAVLPVMIALTAGMVGVQEYLLQSVDGLPRWRLIPTVRLVGLLVVSAGSLILLLLGLHQWVAKRRLTGTESSFSGRIERTAAAEAFRPPRPIPSTWYGASLGYQRPSVTGALLWQATHQSLGVLVLLTIVASIGMTIAQWTRGSLLELAGLVAAIAMFGIAGLTFYGDSVRKRSVFLSDRGVSPTLIWRTRLAPTLIALAIVIAVLLLNRMLFQGRIYRYRSNDLLLILTLMLVGYALTQLVSQWSPRPVLAFLAAPVFFALASFLFAPLFNDYREGALLAAWSSIPVLLFASWRLTPRWLSGSMGRGYALRFIGYLAVALLLPYMMVLSIRAATIPAEASQWRGQLLSLELPDRSDGDQPIEIVSPSENEIGRLRSSWSLEFYLEQPKNDDFEQRYALEMASADSVGKFVSLGELVARMPSWPRGIEQTRQLGASSRLRLANRGFELDAARLLLKWSTMVRKAARDGDASFVQLTRVAEQAEQVVATVLDDLVRSSGITPEIEELIGLFPDDDLVLRSRRNSLIAAWQVDQRRDDRSVAFPGATRPQRFMVLSWMEDLRRDRFIDKTVRLAEQSWRSGPVKDMGQIPGLLSSAAEANQIEPFGALLLGNTRDKIDHLRRGVQSRN